MRTYKTTVKALCAAGFALSMSAGAALADAPGSGARLTTGSGGGAYLTMSSEVDTAPGNGAKIDPADIPSLGRGLTALEYQKLINANQNIRTLMGSATTLSTAQYNSLSQEDRNSLASVGINSASQCPANLKPYYYKQQNGDIKALAVLDKRYESLPGSAGNYTRRWNRVTPELIPKEVTAQVAVPDTRLEQVHYYSNACNLCTASGVQYGGGYRANGLGLEGCCSAYRTGSQWIEVPYFRQATTTSLVLAPIFPDFHVQSASGNTYQNNAYALAPGDPLQNNVTFPVTTQGGQTQYGLPLGTISTEFGGTVAQSQPVDINGIEGAGQAPLPPLVTGFRFDNKPPQ